MKAVVFKNGSLEFFQQYKEPEIKKGYSKIKVLKAGICNTDIEITKGYLNFSGVLGHEFVGYVCETDDPSLRDKRVVGEINFSCGTCEYCRAGLKNHCKKRSVLGIFNADGCMAEYCSVPNKNLLKVPAFLSDDESVFIEPLAAACEILEQLKYVVNKKVLVAGDGKLGILCAWVLSTKFKDVTLMGHNDNKLKLARYNGVKTIKVPQKLEDVYDIVVEATGTTSGLEQSIHFCKPRGIVVLKSTIAEKINFNFTKLVVDEISLIGSRCGQFKQAIDLLKKYPNFPLKRLISAHYPIEKAVEAFEKAKQKGVLKVILGVVKK